MVLLADSCQAFMGLEFYVCNSCNLLGKKVTVSICINKLKLGRWSIANSSSIVRSDLTLG